MFRRTLPRDAVLWWQGEPALSVAVVESGRVGVRAGGLLIDVAGPGTALGEAALLAPGEHPAPRSGDVIVLQDATVLVEHTVAEVRRDPEVMALVLRTVIGQTARNHLLAAAAHPDHALLDRTVAALLRVLVDIERGLGGVTRDWEAAHVIFRLLMSMRTGSDAVRHDLAPPGSWTVDAALGVIDRVHGVLGGSHLGEVLEQYVRLEAERHRA